MSMNFSEFNRILNSDPASQDPAYQAARRSGPEFVQAAAASDAFEQRLARASQLPMPADLTGSLKALAQSAPAGPSPLPYRFRYAIAATLVLAIATAVLLPRLDRPKESVEAFVAHHFSLDGQDVLDRAATPNNEALAVMLAEFDLRMTPELARQVRYVRNCPTPQGVGIHLSLETPQGLITVIFMPRLQVPEGEHFAFNGMAADLLNLPGRDMSVAIIGHPDQLNPALGLAVRNGVQRISSGA